MTVDSLLVRSVRDLPRPRYYAIKRRLVKLKAGLRESQLGRRGLVGN